MIRTAWYNPLALIGTPMVFRMLMICRLSRETIISVRRMLSETETEKYGRPKHMAPEFQMLLFGCETW